MALVKGEGKSVTWCQTLIDMINEAVSIGIFATTDTVATAVTNLESDRDNQ